jgi:adenylate cyclase, class 2
MEVDQTGLNEGMLEIEKKYRLPPERRDAVIASLKESGAAFVGEDFEENTIYGGGKLEQNASIVRLRRTQDRSLLTYKRRVDDNTDVKQQVEYETEIADADVTAKILNELELHPKLVYEKRRGTWQLHETEIVLDELPFGLFMEIEGTIAAIKEAEVLLGIEDLETEHETYPRLTARLGKPKGGTIEARFV